MFNHVSNPHRAECTVAPVFDCGGAGCQEFVTTWAGGTGSMGNFFKIQALKPIVITGLTKMHANGAGLRTVRVYQKAGDYVGFESNSGSWNSVWSNVVTVDSGGGQADLPRFDAPIILDTGEFHSFHIWDSIGKHNCCDQVILCVCVFSRSLTSKPLTPFLHSLPMSKLSTFPQV
jgi:hypothetical protein